MSIVSQIINVPQIRVEEMSLKEGEAPLATLYPIEKYAIEKAVPKRVREFTLGRILARKGMQYFQMEPAAIPMGADRAPIWPKGVAGSISHCDSWCAVAIGKKSQVSRIGIDVEQIRPMTQELKNALCTPNELSLVGNSFKESNRLATMIFSAKEALYKALYPETQQFLGLHCTEIEVLKEVKNSWHWEGKLLCDWGRFKAGQRFGPGQSYFDEQHIASAFVELCNNLC